MKGKLEFDLPEEEVEFKMASQGHILSSIIDDAHNYCRTQIKHVDLCSESEKHLRILRDLLQEGLIHD
jgi:hypothetical protein